MINKFFAFLICVVFLFGSVGATFAADAKGKKIVKAQTNQLTAVLPASDVVMTFDGKRFYNTALPQILSANQTMLTAIINHFDEIKTKFGVDPRQFEQIVVGVGVNKTSPNNYDFAPVALMRGADVKAGALIALFKTAGGSAVREEKIAGKSVYTIKLEDTPLSQKNQTAKPDVLARQMDNTVRKTFESISATAFDDNTLAIGTTARVRELLTGKVRLEPNISELINRNPSSVMNFAAKIPDGFAAQFGLDKDQFGKIADSIRYLSGSADASDGSTKFQLTAKTATAPQAQELFETVQSFQTIGKIALGNSKSTDKQLYAKIIDNVQVSHKLTETTLDLQVAQTDVNTLFDLLYKQKEVKTPGAPTVEK